jgi:UDP-GlcNAc3NAcA epimerase
MPEERNRIVADHLGDVLLAPTPAAMANLGREGLGERAELVGDVMVDAHAWAAERAADHLPAAARGLDRFVLLTLHRAENVDDPARLRAILEGMAIDHTVIFPVHPRTRAALGGGASLPANVIAIDPVGYLEMVALEARAHAIATDSGGVQKEAYLSGVPCITLRSETEWVETVDAGWNRVAGTDPRAVVAALADAAFMDRARPRPLLYGDGQTARRIVAALERQQAGASGARTPQEATAS